MNQQDIVSPTCARVIEILTRTPILISFKCYGSIRNAKNGVVPMPEDGEEIISHHAVSVTVYSQPSTSPHDNIMLQVLIDKYACPL